MPDSEPFPLPVDEQYTASCHTCGWNYHEYSDPDVELTEQEAQDEARDHRCETKMVVHRSARAERIRRREELREEQERLRREQARLTREAEQWVSSDAMRWKPNQFDG